MRKHISIVNTAVNGYYTAGRLRSHDGRDVNGSGVRAILGSLGAHVGGLANWRAEQVGLNGRCAEVDAAQHPRPLALITAAAQHGPASAQKVAWVATFQRKHLCRPRCRATAV